MKIHWLGQSEEGAAWTKYIEALNAKTQTAWGRVQAAYNVYSETRSGLGLPLLAVSKGEGGTDGGLRESDIANLEQLKGLVDFFGHITEGVSAGTRKLGWDENTNEILIEKLPNDPGQLVGTPSGAVQLINAEGIPVPLSGSLAAAPIIWGLLAAGAVSTVGMYFVVSKLCSTAENIVEQRTQQTIAVQNAELVKSGKATPEQAAAMTKTVFDGAAKVQLAKAEVEKAKESEGASPEKWAGLLKAGAWLALAIGGVVVLSKVAPALAPASARLAANPLDEPFTGKKCP